MSKTAEPHYALSDIALIAKRHVHDVRNALNGMELELMVLEGQAGDPVTCEAVGRLRNAASETGRLMQRLASRYAMQEATTVSALQLSEQWRVDARHLLSNSSAEWNIRLATEFLYVEAGLIRTLLADLLLTSTAIAGNKALQIVCRSEIERVIFEVGMADAAGTSRVADSQQPYWAALRRLAERNDATLEPDELGPHCFPLRLVVPVFMATQ